MPKECKDCGVTKPANRFYADPKNVDKRKNSCILCYKGKIVKKNAKKREDTPFLARLDHIKARCKKHGIILNVTRSYLKKIWTGKCAISGNDIFLNINHKDDNAAQVDKIIPSKGYVKGNVQWVSRRYNMLKTDATFEEIEVLYKWMKEHTDG